jgi:hypothetical protein
VADIVTYQGFDSSGMAVVRLWFLDEDKVVEVERLLGKPSASQVYTAEQLEKAHKEIGAVPTVYRDAV